MQAGQTILAARERIDDRVVLELVRQRQPAPVAGVGVEIGQHLVHAAELGVRASAGSARRSSGASMLSAHAANFDLDVERRAVAGVAVRVAQAGEGLVQRVPRRPQAVQVEAAERMLPLRHLGERLVGRPRARPR